MADKYAPQRRYKAANIVKVTVDFNRKSDARLIEKLDEVAKTGSKAGYIKQLIRDDVEREDGSK